MEIAGTSLQCLIKGKLGRQELQPGKGGQSEYLKGYGQDSNTKKRYFGVSDLLGWGTTGMWGGVQQRAKHLAGREREEYLVPNNGETRAKEKVWRK